MFSENSSDDQQDQPPIIITEIPNESVNTINANENNQTERQGVLKPIAGVAFQFKGQAPIFVDCLLYQLIPGCSLHCY